MKIVLASGSPRRREILSLLGVEFESVESGFPEEDVKIDDPRELVEELALQKALKVARESMIGDIVVGGDTVVALESGEILSKLESEEQVREVIGKLSGKAHKVYSGVAVVRVGTLESESLVSESEVKFHELSNEMIEHYVKTGKWRGYAGGYALQGEAARLVEEYRGQLSNIIGMPIKETIELLEKMGVIVEVDGRNIEEEIKGMRVGIE